MIILLQVTMALTFILINLGGFVHNTGASLACPDWPLCFGLVFPKMEGGVLIEHSHRLLASLVGMLTIALVVCAWRRHRPLFKNALVALVLVIIQGIWGGLTVIYRLPSAISTLHLLFSMLYFASLVFLYHRLSNLQVKAQIEEGAATKLYEAAFWILGTFFLVLLQMLLGAWMRHEGQGIACGLGWSSSLSCFQTETWTQHWLPQEAGTKLHMFHRYFAWPVSGAVFFLCRYLQKMRSSLPFASNGPCLWTPFFLVILQVVLGIVGIGMHFSPVLFMLHLAVATLLLMNLWWLFLKVKNSFQSTNPQKTFSFFLRETLELSRPRLSFLVIFTGVIGVLSGGGTLNFASLVVIIALAKVVAGASILNAYIERDIDALMPRTRKRPLVTQTLSPQFARQLGTLLHLIFLPLLFYYGGIQIGFLVLAASIIYLLIYTPMKQTSPWALYVGTIPGAIPPAVGSIAALGQWQEHTTFLFLILTIWQVPHFFAISNLYAPDYQAGGIKTFFQKWGAKKTKVMIFITTLLHCGLMFVPSFIMENPFSEFGMSVVITLSALVIFYGLYGFFLDTQNQKFHREWLRRYFLLHLSWLPIVFLALFL